MSALFAVIATAVLAGIAVVQVLGALGTPVGHLLWGGQHETLPKNLRIGSALSVLLYAAFAVLLLSRAGSLPGGNSTFAVVSTWVLFGYFVIGIVMNGISRSRAERATMTPACVVLAALTLAVALEL
ncbi:MULTISPECIES: hypothetical protein [unclassified Pseudoclavibacter]|uniref:hypothetical protein n=1 Tax=unclassified Pseudoclavibacter TaxID=2615177 RepID=UPI001BAA9491|nr:hypothetical protein [Pseudoclavibacter sp. Marseille-Q4354]MBS3180403.1 hypothetical protein [Pseudoclavibacter sp. Marseille-Q4354]